MLSAHFGRFTYFASLLPFHWHQLGGLRLGRAKVATVASWQTQGVLHLSAAGPMASGVVLIRPDGYIALISPEAGAVQSYFAQLGLG